MPGWYVPVLGIAQPHIDDLVDNLSGSVDGTLSSAPNVGTTLLAGASAGDVNDAVEVLEENLKELNTKIDEIRQALIDAGIMDPS